MGGEEGVATVMLRPVWNLGQTARADHKATTTTGVAAVATLLAASSRSVAGGGDRQALTSSPASEVEDTQNKFLNFRCIDAAITGKVNQDSVTGGSGTTGTQGSAVSFGKSNS